MNWIKTAIAALLIHPNFVPKIIVIIKYITYHNGSDLPHNSISYEKIIGNIE